MKYRILALLLLAVITVMGQDLVILHTNDFHAHLNGKSPEAEYTPFINDGDPTRGGMARIAGFVKEQESQYSDKVVLLDGGDFLMGSLFQSLELYDGFQLNLMHEVGYDYLTIGNHEFDFGADKLAGIINAGRKNGEIPEIVMSNYKSAEADSALVDLLSNGTISPYHVFEKNGIKIGIFGLLGIDARESVASEFNLKVKNPARVARKTSQYLKNKQGADLIIMLSHSGLYKDSEGEWQGEDIKYAKAAPDIDLIISGHSHSEIEELIRVNDTFIAQTGAHGSSVGKLVVFHNDGDFTFEYKLIPMDDEIDADRSIQTVINERSKMIEDSLIRDLQVNTDDPVVETDFDLVMNEADLLESNLGPFVSDALHYYVNSGNNKGADIAVVASGVIRSNMHAGKKGHQNIHDIFNIMSLGIGENNEPGAPLANVHVKGRELKKVLELILQVSEKRSNYFLYFSGMKVYYNPDEALFKKIQRIEIGNDQEGYVPMDFDKDSPELYSMVANTYMVGFISNLKKMSFGLVNVVPKDENGDPIENNDYILDFDHDQEGVQEVKEWKSIYHFISTFADDDKDGIKEIPEEYRTRRPNWIITE